MSVSNVPPEGTPEGARAAGRGYWFTPMPVYLLDAVYDPDSPVNAPAAILWAHVHRHYAWRERVFPSYACLAEETKQSESAVKRQLNALKAAGAITWGATYRARGRSSNEYALAVVEPFRFDRETARPVQVKNDLHPQVQVKNDPPVGLGNDLHPQVKNGPGVESSSYLESTDESLSPSVPSQRAESPDVADERETFSSIDELATTTTPAAVPDAPADRIVAAYTGILGRPILSRTRAALHHQAAEALTAGYPESWLTDRARELAAHGWSDLAKHVEKSTAPLPGTAPSSASRADGVPSWCGECGNGMPARLNIRFRRRADGTLCHCHPDAAQGQPLPGTDTTVSGWLALADQLGGRTGGAQPRPSVTDQRVQAAIDLGRQMQAEYDAQQLLDQQAAVEGQPYGWDPAPQF